MPFTPQELAEMAAADAEIETACGVDPSSVCKGLKRARKRLHRVLKYVNPALLHPDE